MIVKVAQRLQRAAEDVGTAAARHTLSISEQVQAK